MPVFCVSTETDHVAPWKSVYKVDRYVQCSEFTFLLTSGGHNAGIISGPAHPKRRHRVRTRKAALARVVELLAGLGPLEELALVHTHAPEESEALARMAGNLIPGEAASLSAEVTPVIGTHIGPGAVGFVAVQARS